MIKINEYFALEIKDENGVWHKSDDWKIRPKYIRERVEQLKEEGKEVRVKKISEYQHEEILEEWLKYD